MEHCVECGFSYDLDTAPESGTLIAKGVAELAAALTRPAADVRARREPETWSPLEYGCHVRDTLLVQRERVLAALRDDRPSTQSMGREERVEHDGYAAQEPADVANQLTMAAQLFTHVLSRLDEHAWQRTLIYNYPEPTERTLRWVALHTLHEVTHHRLDIDRQLD